MTTATTTGRARPTRRDAVATLAAFTGLAALGTPAWAQGDKFPSKPVTLIVPYSAGGGTDIVGRLVAQRLSELWGQSVVVDNRTGANGVIGSSHVAKARPDGHTLLLVVGSHAINPVLMKNMPYDTVKDFTAITEIAASPTVLVVQAAGPYKTLGDVIQAGRKADLAAGYSEGQTRLTVEMIRQAANLKLTGVPYKGGAPIMVDIIGGHLPMGATSVLTALPHVQSGALRVVGVAAAKRMPIFPDAQTFDEIGVKGVDSESWYGLFGPAGMPDDIVTQIVRDVRKVTSEPAVAEQMRTQGARVVVNSPDEFRGFLQKEVGKWSQVAQRGGIVAE
ncbi:tripartite tricarboxylate transporter substrate binding protein [Xylophilus sp. GOD-11R]|uniref:tripartite tricarboxylate transporter substrate binding protein n=1 Tax=Xylophilus sp. GOD-11R TaxID=3089814 RepID=UPI00298CF6F9|nr:tripartite tricarboxylate transporter substrate binding protein [Xylophilus sp. GOD-11R]WPB55525.1 tripartite tricarboxylate transporter substrate binding protein [Xylophilus sp. GOD-11R]